MGYRFGQTARGTMDSFSLIANTAKVSKHGQMVGGMKAIGLEGLRTGEADCTTQRLGLSKKANGKMGLVEVGMKRLKVRLVSPSDSLF